LITERNTVRYSDEDDIKPFLLADLGMVLEDAAQAAVACSRFLSDCGDIFGGQ
jgi:hypothetical protein